MTMDDAKAFANWVAKEKHLGEDPGSTLLSRTQGVVVTRIGIQSHIPDDRAAEPELDAKTDKFFRSMAEGLSEQVFRGPVDVNLCDDKLATKKVIAWR